MTSIIIYNYASFSFFYPLLSSRSLRNTALDSSGNGSVYRKWSIIGLQARFFVQVFLLKQRRYLEGKYKRAEAIDMYPLLPCIQLEPLPTHPLTTPCENKRWNHTHPIIAYTRISNWQSEWSVGSGERERNSKFALTRVHHLRGTISRNICQKRAANRLLLLLLLVLHPVKGADFSRSPPQRNIATR